MATVAHILQKNPETSHTSVEDVPVFLTGEPLLSLRKHRELPVRSLHGTGVETTKLLADEPNELKGEMVIW